MADPARCLVVISDTHCGSTVGLMPPLFVTNEGQTLQHTKEQEWIWKQWLSVQAELAEYLGGSPFHLLLNGDLIDGIHHNSLQLISQDWLDHVNCATACLLSLAERADKVLVTKGTECHTRNAEHALADELGAVPCPTTKQSAVDNWQFEMAGVWCSFHHHIGGTSRRYLEASQYSIHIGNEQLNCLRAGHRVPRVFGRAHRHTFGQFCDGANLMVVGPPWQLGTRYVAKAIPGARTAVGLYVLDWRNREDGQLPHVEPMIRQTKPAQGIKL